MCIPELQSRRLQIQLCGPSNRFHLLPEEQGPEVHEGWFFDVQQLRERPVTSIP
jgi:hypothetical protein